jgi:hypothetical protein
VLLNIVRVDIEPEAWPGRNLDDTIGVAAQRGGLAVVRKAVVELLELVIRA